MATQTLVDRQIEGGVRLLEVLDAAGLDVPVAFWEYRSDWGAWRLVLGTDMVDTHGKQATYAGIHAALRQKPELRSVQDRITVISLRDERVRALRQTYRLPKGGEGIWLGRSGAHGVYFEDAYLYRSA